MLIDIWKLGNDASTFYRRSFNIGLFFDKKIG